jgi:hypothetical protein
MQPLVRRALQRGRWAARAPMPPAAAKVRKRRAHDGVVSHWPAPGACRTPSSRTASRANCATSNPRIHRRTGYPVDAAAGFCSSIRVVTMFEPDSRMRQISSKLQTCGIYNTQSGLSLRTSSMRLVAATPKGAIPESSPASRPTLSALCTQTPTTSRSGWSPSMPRRPQQGQKAIRPKPRCARLHA